MKHFGDITKISGYAAPVVDIITGGSPCQDLSVAGKRAGLAGERSGLFMEQIRIVKEMRARDRDTGRTGVLVRPRYMVWENVPGAFSSNGGKDFQAVLEEIVLVVETEVPDLSTVVQGGWTKSGILYGEMGDWSVAWRVHDAQFWGVPQRRKRIALVADFGGLSAPEILFERKGLSGDSEPCGAERERTAAAVGDCPAFAVSFQERAGCPGGGGKGILIQDERTGALSTLNNQAVCQIEPILLESNQNHATVQTDGICTALPASMGMGGGYVPMVAGFKAGNGAKSQSIGYEEEKSPTIAAAPSGTNQIPAVFDARGNGDGATVPTLTGDYENLVTDYTALCIGNGQLNQVSMSELANTLDTMHDQQAVMVTAVDCRNMRENPEINGTLQAKESGFSYNLQNVCRTGATVRRLTPLECERLQGYPDRWTSIGKWTDSKGKRHKEADSPRYKALGNSIALPFWAWLARRICAQYERPMTMASLFDGIGGFPLVFSRAGATPVWASEIEEFPIAVTKRHFPEEETT